MDIIVKCICIIPIFLNCFELIKNSPMYTCRQVIVCSLVYDYLSRMTVDSSGRDGTLDKSYMN